jgi:hypothetical protein
LNWLTSTSGAPSLPDLAACRTLNLRLLPRLIGKYELLNTNTLTLPQEYCDDRTNALYQQFWRSPDVIWGSGTLPRPTMAYPIGLSVGNSLFSSITLAAVQVWRVSPTVPLTNGDTRCDLVIKDRSSSSSGDRKGPRASP